MEVKEQLGHDVKVKRILQLKKKKNKKNILRVSTRVITAHTRQKEIARVYDIHLYLMYKLNFLPKVSFILVQIPHHETIFFSPPCQANFVLLELFKTNKSFQKQHASTQKKKKKRKERGVVILLRGHLEEQKGKDYCNGENNASHDNAIHYFLKHCHWVCWSENEGTY